MAKERGNIFLKESNRRESCVYSRTCTESGSRRRLVFYCEEWMRMHKSQIKESTYVKYDYTLRCHILPKLGGCLPAEVDTRLVEDFKQELLEEGLSARSVKSTLLVLHAILSYASKQHPGLFPPVEIRYPRESRNVSRVLDAEEQERLVCHLSKNMDACRFGILLALATGLRIGEICAMRWKNISLKSGTLRVDATMQRIRDTDSEGERKTKILVGDPKSNTSVRTIPLSESLIEFCTQNDPHCQAAFVLTGTEEYMEPRKLQRRIAKYTKECGLEGVHFHTLRHTFATRCMEIGFDLKSLSEILGHAKTSTTLDRYVHSSLNTKRSNMEKLDCFRVMQS